MPLKFELSQRENRLVDVAVLGSNEDFVPKITICYRNNTGALKELKEKRKNEGTYILIQPVLTPKKKNRLYFGKSDKGGLSGRLSTHNRKHPHQKTTNWVLAVLIHGHIDQKKKSEKKLSSDEVDELEFQLGAILRYQGTVFANVQRVSMVEKISNEQLERLESYKEPIIQLLKTLGHIQQKQQKKTKKKARKPSNMPSEEGLRGNEELAKLIKQGKLKVGQKLVSTSPSYPAEAKIVDDNGRIQVISVNFKKINPPNVKEFKSLSQAGLYVKKIIDPKQVNSPNGWDFWGYEEKISIGAIRKKSKKGNKDLDNLIQEGLLKIGDKLFAEYKAVLAEAEINDASGKINILQIGKKTSNNLDFTYQSLSLNVAGEKIVKYINPKGARRSSSDFWSVIRIKDLQILRDR